MQVLDGCTAPVKYGYAPITRKKDRVTMRDADDLYANMPIGAARLEAKLEKSGQLDVDMTMVGRWEAERRAVRADELQGSCDGATHVVSALTVGAFTFTAGADATVQGRRRRERVREGERRRQGSSGRLRRAPSRGGRPAR